jgi:dienelactone hydrolase
MAACGGSLRLTPSDAATVLATRTLEAPDPGEAGPYEVGYLTYGSGTDRRRAAYRDSVAFRTDSVDASTLVSLGSSAGERNEYWGFSPEGFPLNARVWYPRGEGPFPLVLVVHGNHDPQDFSDPGYDYLGELLASRGMILASIDMNFINGGIRGENDGRGWLLLKHLQAWRGFDADPDNPFHEGVDMSRIALMGHSRGGEAVAVAAAFNRLPRYPDDASLTFDFGFDLRAIVAIAPVDGQYLPTGRYAPVQDVDYMVFHGSHDGDVTSFHGLRTWDRVRFTGSEEHFKSAVYMYRANHGQWNSVWNSFDNGPRSARILELDGLVEPGEQRRMAELFISAFLEASLKGDRRWLSIFRDHRVAGDWLPPTMYVTRFQHSSFVPLATFEEDIDVTTGTAPGVELRGDSLAIWKEEELRLRSANRSSTSASQMNQAVRLAWNNEVRGGAATDPVPPARYVVSLPAGWAVQHALDPRHSLSLSLAATDATPAPRDPPGADEGEAAVEEAAGDEERNSPRAGVGADPGPTGSDSGQASDGAPEPMDLSVEVEDAAGHVARVALSRYGPVRRPLEIRILRRSDVEERRFAEPWDLVLQSYEIPLGDLVREAPGLDLNALSEVRLVFDRTSAGEVVVDEIGVSRLGPDFWSAPVPEPPSAAGGG